jgi:hypothetical protein
MPGGVLPKRAIQMEEEIIQFSTEVVNQLLRHEIHPHHLTRRKEVIIIVIIISLNNNDRHPAGEETKRDIP